MSTLYYEGTKDWVQATPAMIVSLRASGSITAGYPLKWDAGNTSDVWADTNGVVGKCAGLALTTVATGAVCAVLVWGYAKNLLANETLVPGDFIMASGSTGAFAKLTAGTLSGSTTIVNYYAGRVVSGSTTAGLFTGFINCM
jgi:hypothetical protein